MGKGQGWLGSHAILCAIFISLCKFLQPALVVHECTTRFPHKVFGEQLKNYKDFHHLVNAYYFGIPVQRRRVYDCLVNEKFYLADEMENLYQFSSKCVLDASLWLQAPLEEVLC